MYIGVLPVNVSRLSAVVAAQVTLSSLSRRQSLVRQVCRPPYIPWKSIHHISVCRFCFARAGHVSGWSSFSEM